MRTCFRRELNIQKNTKPGQASSKRRKYIYLDKLLFLLPCIENLPSEGDIRPDDVDEEETDPLAWNSTPSPKRKKPTIDLKPTAKDLDDALLKASNDKKDEDMHFALSLVPSLQALTAEEKLDAKISILKVFKEIRLARHGQSTSK